MNARLIKLLLVAILVPGLATAEESGFLEDYSILGVIGEHGAARMYLPSTSIKRLADYNKVMVDQPLIYLDPDSKSKGMKPDTMTSIAEMLREAMKKGFGNQYETVEEKGEGVLYFRWAITNMYLEKPKRGLLAFTPVGAVGYAAKGAMSDFIDKNELVELRLEGEMRDSVTGELLLAMTLQRGQRKDKKAKVSEDEATWEELFAVGETLGRRFGCRLNNARAEASERQDCSRIVIGK